MELRSAAFPHCCGLSIIGGFGYTTTGDANAGFKLELDELGKKLDQAIAHRKVTHEYGMVVATLNNQQKDHVGPLLESRGFTLVSSCHHPYHKTDIYLYTLVLFPEGVVPPEELATEEDYYVGGVNRRRPYNPYRW